MWNKLKPYIKRVLSNGNAPEHVNDALHNVKRSGWVLTPLEQGTAAMVEYHHVVRTTAFPSLRDTLYVRYTDLLTRAGYVVEPVERKHDGSKYLRVALPGNQ